MKISHSWLHEYVSHQLAPNDLSELLTMSGLEVEAVESLGTALDGVVVGYVLDVRKHPGADRLSVCLVDIGGEEPVQIVCGAPNVAVGQKVPVATVGSRLPNRENPDKPFKIKKAKMRGEVSMGMICAEDELGLSDDHAGIMVLGDEAPVGIPVSEFLASSGSMMRDSVLDIAITPNRPDAISHIGVARDVAALTDLPLRRPEIRLPEPGGEAADCFSVDIQAPEGCGRYVGILVRGITIGESPNWLKHYLEAIGLRPRNNVVDITNFAMHECGQPLHAFDFDQIAGKRILVRFTEREKNFVTLDDKERTLPAGTLMIADADRDVAIAGVMGGQNSEVTETTTNVLIESAYFDPATIRRTARKLQLQTDASYRFERGVDPEGQVWAAARAASLMCELAGGSCVPGMVDAHPRPVPTRHVNLRLARIPRILGVAIDKRTATRLLSAIGFGVGELEAGILTCTVPSFRPDVEREIDLIEEVGRLYGFDRISEPTHSCIPAQNRIDQPTYRLRTHVLQTMSGVGFREIYTNSMLPQATAERFLLPSLQGLEASATVVQTLNPISQEMATLRPMLLPGMLQVMSHNWNHGQRALRFMEFGHVFHRTTGAAPFIPGYAESESFLMAMSGAHANVAWDTHQRELDFFDLKGVIHHLLASLRIREYRVSEAHEQTDLTAYHMEVYSGNRRLGYMARLSDHYAQLNGLKSPVFFAELDWEALVLAATPNLIVKYRDVSRFPVVDRDLALVVDRTAPAGPMINTIKKAGRPLLQDVGVFDQYIGKGVDPSKKSIAFSLRFAADRTLTDKEVDAQVKAIIEQLARKHEATLRT